MPGSLAAPTALASRNVPTFNGSETKKEEASIWIPIKLAVIPIAAVFSTAIAERNARGAEAFGYWLGAMLLPTLVSLIVVRFRPAKRMRTFSTVFICVGAIGILGSLASTWSTVSRPSKTPQELMKEAAGTKPVEDSGSLSEQKTNRLARGVMGDVLEARKKHDAAFAPIAPVIATLYTPGSFASKKRIEDVIGATRKALQVDGELYGKFEHWPQETNARVDASDLDAEAKKEFLNGFQQSFGNSEIMGVYREVHRDEEEWGAATIDLYTFALQHATELKTTSQQVILPNKDLLDKFNAKLKKSQNLRRKFQAVHEHLAAVQAASLRKLGMTKGDLGLEK